jgi:ferric-dicitrate binding protein FerR (iron transport regulator)
VERAEEPVRRGYSRILLWGGAVAASLMIAFFVGHYEGRPKNYPTTYHTTANTISTRYGSKSKLELPDGTEVWLNADSKLTYGKEFGTQSREVSLSGEAFFEVQKDADRPFIIHTGNMDIRVLGTAFNVRSYQNEKTSEATLVRGAIEVVLRDSPDRRIVLKPKDRIVVQNSPAPATNGQAASDESSGTIYSMSRINARPADSAALENSWKRSGLSFHNETLENAAFRIEHWFNVKVNIRDEELKQGTYSCDFKNESLEQVLEALHFTGKFRYRIEKDSVIIFR